MATGQERLRRIGMSTVLPALSAGQYQFVYAIFLATAAFMAVCFCYFVFVSGRVAKWFRPAMFMSAFIVAASAAHYLFIADRWAAIYEQQGTLFQPTGEFLQALYRYVYWLPTVPMLLVSLIVVLALSKSLTRSLSVRLYVATVAMIVLGYPGEIATDISARGLWGTLSTLPFIYILYVLWAEPSAVLADQPARVATLVRNSRLLILFSWGFFPVIYLLPILNLESGSVQVALQAGYVVADWIAKAGFGFIIYAIAKKQTRYEVGLNETSGLVAAAAGD